MINLKMVLILCFLLLAQPEGIAQSKRDHDAKTVFTTTSFLMSDDLQRRIQSEPDISLAFEQEGPMAAYQLLKVKLNESVVGAKDWALLGELALIADLPDAARQSLERAVLIDPNLPGAWLDLSVALLRLGEMEQSQQYLDYVQREFAPQEKMQLIVNQLQSKIKQLVEKKYRWQYVVTTGLGYDSNANSGLSTNLIALTSGTDRILLTLSDDYQARPDFYGVMGIQAKQERTLSGTDWKLQYGYGLRQRQFFKESNFSTSELGIQIQGIRPNGIGSYLFVSGQFEYIRLGQQSVLADTRLTLAHDISWDSCQMMPGLELEKREHLLESQLSGQITWAVGHAVCQWGAWRGGLIGRAGFDRPTGQRAGGQTHRMEAQLYADKKLSEHLHIKLLIGVFSAKDREGYSPWLENEARRFVSRMQYRSEFTYQWAPDWQFIWGLEKNTTSSNIPIFIQSAWQTYVQTKVHF